MSFAQFQLRRGTPAQWTEVNPVLADGEIGLEKGTSQFKVGDGVTPWNDLAYGGLVGPVGPQGPAGPQGPPGSGDGGTGYEHDQTTPSAVWTVQHSLGYPPGGITVLGATGELILGWTATHPSNNVLVLTFPAAHIGTAYVS